ncbi:MAG: DUF333 domain-containing protein [Anaerolineaceae bacterium]|nr:DUF333 domain-containing protein [Anaerolineaceae bacterium]
MKRKNKLTIITIFGALALLMAACSPALDKTQEPTDNPTNVIGLANPAAVYCESLGFTLESVERNGGEDADCVFSDGSQCPQWDFLAGRCGQAFSYCEQQGGTLEEGGNVGICRFPDGSYCDEYAFLTGDCAMGDNPGEASAVTEEEGGTPADPEIAPDDIVIQGFDDAFDYILGYMQDQYDFAASEAWAEADITTDNATATTTHRYVSGPLTVVISSMASAPATNYVINEVSDLTNGFVWRGSLSYNGTILTDEVYLPATIKSVEEARDAVLAHLNQAYGTPVLNDWSDEGSSQGNINDHPTTIRTFAANNWVMLIEFEPSTPLVGTYYVTVEDESGNFSWEGTITLYGEITEGNTLP